MNKRWLIGTVLPALSLVWAHCAIAGEPAYAPQVSNENGVKITATLQNVAGDAQWGIDVVMETHTHPLGESLETASVLIGDGKQYAPLAWEGSPPGGHHRKGTLRFKAISPLPATVELQIRLSGESSPRSFRWRVK